MFDTLIPKIFHRTIPLNPSDEMEKYWSDFQSMHPGWEFMSWDEPVDPGDFPISGHLFDQCQNGAQKAGLIRLEAIYAYGGVYVDSDVRPVRPFNNLLYLPAFAAWEDEKVIPDAVLGGAKGHPLFGDMLHAAMGIVLGGGGAWESGPGITTFFMSQADDALVFPPGAFYPHHYLEKAFAGTRNNLPWVICEHMWHGSWVSDRVREYIENNQKKPGTKFLH